MRILALKLGFAEESRLTYRAGSWRNGPAVSWLNFRTRNSPDYRDYTFGCRVIVESR